MTENEKLRMADAMHNFQKAKEDPETVWNEFLGDAAETLEALIAAIKATPEFQALADEEDDDTVEYYEEEAIVLYVSPGEPFSLMEEGDAIDEFLMAGHNCGICFKRITGTLQIAYPVDSVIKNSDGSITVTGPVYISHPIVGEACIDLSAVELMEAVAYLATRQVKVRKGAETVYGYLLKKED